MQETQEMQVPSLHQEDPLERGIAAHSKILPGKSHGQRRLAGYSPRNCKESDMTATEHTVFAGAPWGRQSFSWY